jgi:hypothetical protein
MKIPIILLAFILYFYTEAIFATASWMPGGDFNNSTGYSVDEIYFNNTGDNGGSPYLAVKLSGSGLPSGGS